MTIRDEIDDLIDGRLTWTDLVERRRLSVDEAALFRSYLRRTGIRAAEHIADARASRRVEELAEAAIRIDCGTETLDEALDRLGATTSEERRILTAQILAAAERVADEIVAEVRRRADE